MANEARLQIVIDALNQASDELKAVRDDLKGVGEASKESGDAAEKGGGQFKIAGLSLTDMASGISLAKQGLQTLKQVWEFGKQGAENERIAASFEATAESVGVSAEQMAAALDKAAKGTVDDEIFMQTATRNMALGVATTVQENVALMELARAASVKFGGETETAFEGISTAIGNLQTRQLKQYGIIIDVKEVNEKYAAALGTTADALTEAQQREALRNAVLAQSVSIMGQAGNVALTTGEKFKRFETQVGNAFDTVKEGLADVIGPMLTDGQQMGVVLDETALASDRLAAAQDVLANGTLRAKVEVLDMIPSLQKMADAEAALAMTTEEQAVRAAMGQIRAFEEFDRVAGAAADQLLDVADASDVTGSTLDKLGEKAAANKQAMEDIAAANAAAKQQAGEHAAAQANLAEKLSNTAKAEINAELAKAAIGGLGALQAKDPEAYAEAVGKIQIAYGLATEKGQAMAKGVDVLTQAFNTGQISRDDFVKAIGLIPKAADDGKISIYEFGIKVVTADQAAQAAALKMADLKASIDKTGEGARNATANTAAYNIELGKIPKQITTTIIQKYETQGSPTTGTPDIPSRASGGPTGMGGLYRLHPDEWVLNSAQRRGREPIPAAAIPAAAAGGATRSVNNYFYDTLATTMYLERERLEDLRGIEDQM